VEKNCHPRSDRVESKRSRSLAVEMPMDLATTNMRAEAQRKSGRGGTSHRTRRSARLPRTGRVVTRRWQMKFEESKRWEPGL